MLAEQGFDLGRRDGAGLHGANDQPGLEREDEAGDEHDNKWERERQRQPAVKLEQPRFHEGSSSGLDMRDTSQRNQIETRKHGDKNGGNQSAVGYVVLN